MRVQKLLVSNSGTRRGELAESSGSFSEINGLTASTLYPACFLECKTLTNLIFGIMPGSGFGIRANEKRS